MYIVQVNFGITIIALIATSIFLILSNSGDSTEGPSLRDVSEKHFLINDVASNKVFGYGADVNTLTRYEIHFDFEVSESIKGIYYLYFDYRNIERSDEVSITLNNVPIYNIPGGLGDYTKTQKIKMPTKHLIKGNLNELLFDNAKNSRSDGEEEWLISKVRMQMVPIPPCGVENGECVREASARFQSAEKLWTARSMAASNAYNALAELNTSILFMEALEQKPDFFPAVQQMIRDVERFLDQTCSKTLLQVKRDEEMKDWQKAVKELKNGLLWFPGPEHRCAAQLKEKLEEYGE